MGAPNLKLEPTTNNTTDDNSTSVTPVVESEKKPAASKYKKWLPKRWEPIFEEMVLLSVLGKTTKEIAAKYGYSGTHTSCILNCAQAKLLRRQLHENLRKNIELSTENRLDHLKDKALTRMTQVMNNEDLVVSHPLAVFDRAATILRGTGILKTENPAGTNVNAKNAIFLPPEFAAGILKGMEMADKAKQLNSGDSEIVVEGKVTNVTTEK